MSDLVKLGIVLIVGGVAGLSDLTYFAQWLRPFAVAMVGIGIVLVASSLSRRRITSLTSLLIYTPLVLSLAAMVTLFYSLGDIGENFPVFSVITCGLVLTVLILQVLLVFRRPQSIVKGRGIRVWYGIGCSILSLGLLSTWIVAQQSSDGWENVGLFVVLLAVITVLLPIGPVLLTIELLKGQKRS